MPDPSDLFTSPAGLMALLYGRTGSVTHLFPSSSASPSSRVVAKQGEKHVICGREARRERQNRKRHYATTAENRSGEDRCDEDSGHHKRACKRGSALVSKQAMALAVAIFFLSALWDLFTSQKSVIWSAIKNSVATTLEVRSSSHEFAMIVDWMGRQPHGQRIRNLSLKPIAVQDEQKAMWGEQTVTPADGAPADARVALVPGYGSHFFRFGSTWVHITRAEDPSKQKAAATNRVDRENDKLILTFMTRRRAVVQQFLEHVHASWTVNVRNTIQLYLSEGYGPRWRLLSERLRRPLSTLYLPAATKAVVEEAKLFLQLKDTYSALGIPWRRGYLFEGPPGTGKTSFVMALAGELGLPVHILSLRSDNMDDDALLSLTSCLPRRSILLIEDLENVLKISPFPEGGSVRTNLPNNGETTESPVQSAATPSFSTDIGGGPRSTMSLSALLNALDGVASSEGRLLIITTNDTRRIPFAEVLLRPGRIDRRISFQPLHHHHFREMEESFQRALRDDTANPLGAGAAMSLAAKPGFGDAQGDKPVCTPAQYQQRLLDTVYASFLEKNMERAYSR